MPQGKGAWSVLSIEVRSQGGQGGLCLERENTCPETPSLCLLIYCSRGGPFTLALTFSLSVSMLAQFLIYPTLLLLYAKMLYMYFARETSILGITILPTQIESRLFEGRAHICLQQMEDNLLSPVCSKEATKHLAHSSALSFCGLTVFWGQGERQHAKGSPIYSLPFVVPARLLYSAFPATQFWTTYIKIQPAQGYV